MFSYRSFVGYNYKFFVGYECTVLQSEINPCNYIKTF